MTEMDSSVSVIIPVYNAERSLEAAVASALVLPEVLEVILVEDASPDNALQVCERLAADHAKVFLYRHPDHVNHGAGASRNLGISKAHGTYVAFLDADDLFLPDRFSAERRIFTEHADADGVYGALGVHYHDEAARRHFLSIGQAEMVSVAWAPPPEQLFRCLVETGKGFGYFSIVALTVVRTVLVGMKPIFRTELALHQDTDFLLRLAFSARLYPGSIDRPVALRGVHAGNRITHNTREAFTRHLLYTHLWKWAATVPMERSLARRIQAEHVRFSILNTNGTLQLLWFARRFIGKAWLLNVMDVRKTWFDALFGADSKASVLMQKITWRMLNGIIPKPVRASDTDRS
jgi:glycosyltransferase involved in cell wall biosynthesis